MHGFVAGWGAVVGCDVHKKIMGVQGGRSLAIARGGGTEHIERICKRGEITLTQLGTTWEIKRRYFICRRRMAVHTVDGGLVR